MSSTQFLNGGMITRYVNQVITAAQLPVNKPGVFYIAGNDGNAITQYWNSLFVKDRPIYHDVDAKELWVKLSNGNKIQLICNESFIFD